MIKRVFSSPGVEIHEIDRSQYNPLNGGSSTALVMGFANSGENYKTTNFTSKTALVNYFGEPTNEAERYFFAACSEVLAQNGNLLAAKLPYTNEATDVFSLVRYTVTPSTSISSLSGVINYENLVSKHNTLSDSVEFTNDLRSVFLSEFAMNEDIDSAMLISLNAPSAIYEFILSAYNPESLSDGYQLSDDITGTLSGSSLSTFTLLVDNVLETASIDKLETYFKKDETTVEEIKNGLSGVSDFCSLIKQQDSSISTVTVLSGPDEDSLNNTLRVMDINTLDSYITGEGAIPQDSIIIVDKLGGQYSKTNDGKEVLGIVPVITTATNAVYFQNLIDVSSSVAKYYSPIANILDNKYNEAISDSETSIPLIAESFNGASVSQTVTNYFPGIGMVDMGTLDKENLRKIGIVVLRAYVDPSASNKVSFDVLESFVGDIKKGATNPVTGATTFIDNIVNATSEYIYVFSNVQQTLGDILSISGQNACSLGFTSSQMVKNITVSGILNGIKKVFASNEDIHERAIDYIVDAGVSNIAQYIYSVYGNSETGGEFDPTGEYSKMFKLRNDDDKAMWLNVLKQFNTFCSLTRKDCIFIADGLRPLVLTGSKKVVRPSKISNSVEGNIIANLKFISGLNTTYGAGYCDWFLVSDEFTGETFWCPPSIQAIGANIYTDLNFGRSQAPAGMTRGVISALDCAFSPTRAQASQIYLKSWNYAVNYADVGLILEGQKTLSLKPTSLDRVASRKELLYIERQIYNISRRFIYEPNTDYTRQRFLDMVNAILQIEKGSGAIYDFKAICDTTINTVESINANELRCRIGVSLLKFVEFVIIEMVATKYGTTWEELENI